MRLGFSGYVVNALDIVHNVGEVMDALNIVHNVGGVMDYIRALNLRFINTI